MKKLFLAALATIMLTGCGKEGYDWGNKGDFDSSELGKVTLSVNEGNVVKVKSATATVEDGVELNAYKVFASKSDYTVEAWNNKTYGEILTAQQTTVTIPAGIYNLSAESCTEEAAEADRGKPRFYGSSTFEVVAGSQIASAASVECTMANAKVSVGYTELMSTYFDDYKVSITGSYTKTSGTRASVLFDKNSTHEATAAAAFFNIPQSGTQTITVVVEAKKKNASEFTSYEAKTYDLAATTWHKITVGTTTTTEGKAALTISVNGTVEVLDHEINVNPYN